MQISPTAKKKVGFSKLGTLERINGSPPVNHGMVDSVTCLRYAECSCAPDYIINGYGYPMLLAAHGPRSCLSVRTQPLTATGARSQTSTIPYHTIPYHTLPYHTIPYHTIPYHTIPYHTIPYHAVPYHTIVCTEERRPTSFSIFSTHGAMLCSGVCFPASARTNWGPRQAKPWQRC